MSILSNLQRRLARRVVKQMIDDSVPGSPLNMYELASLPKRVRMIELNVKALGYDLARKLAASLPPLTDVAEQQVGLISKASTQADMSTDWVRHWLAQLQAPLMFHRKMWELAYVLQAIHDHGHMQPGRRGLGFGCGVEPHPSYLASRGIDVTITDIDQGTAVAQGWVATDQHLGQLAQAHYAHLVAREVFDERVTFRVADMNRIPEDLRGYDFCWSMCAIEHLGSIDAGLAFLRNALATIRPGGLSVHTMEFNVVDDGPTLETGPTVLFQRRHIERIAETLRAEGHDVATLDFDYGTGPLDRFIDVPPYPKDPFDDPTALIGEPQHLKLTVGDFIATCFGLIVRKAA